MTLHHRLARDHFRDVQARAKAADKRAERHIRNTRHGRQDNRSFDLDRADRYWLQQLHILPKNSALPYTISCCGATPLPRCS